MADAARPTGPRKQAKRRTYGAVSLLTATALLTTLTSTPSYAHDENIITYGSNAEFEYITWSGNSDASGQLGITIKNTDTTQWDPANRRCVAVIEHNIRFLNDSSSAQRTKMRAAITAAFDNKRMVRGDSFRWQQVSKTGAYRVKYTSPDFGSISRCPDILNPGNLSRTPAMNARGVDEEMVDFMASYGVAGATFVVAAIVGAVAGAAAGSVGTATAYGAAIGCAAGAVAQAIVGAYFGRSAADVAKRGAFACMVDAAVGTVSAVAGAWAGAQVRAAGGIRHIIADTLGRTRRYFDLDDVDAGLAGAREGIEQARAAGRIAVAARRAEQLGMS